MLQASWLYLLGNLAGKVVGFLAIPFYTRFLTPAQYGLIELIELSTQTIAIALGLQAIGAALSRLFHDQRSLEAEQAVVSTSLIATGVISAVVTIVAVAGAVPLSQAVFHTPEWANLLRAAFIAMFMSEMIEVVLVYERIRNHAQFVLVYSLVMLGLTLSLNILFIGFLEAGVWGFVASKLVVSAGACVVMLLRARRDIGWHWRGLYVPQLVKFGAPLILSSLAYFAIHFSDRFFLSASVSLAELGRYAMAYQFAILISALVGDSFNKSWGVTLYRYTERPDWQRQFAQVASYLTYVLFATAMGIALFYPEVLRVMVPADYLPPPLLLPILLAAYLTREIGDFFRTLLLINKRSGLVSRIAIGSAVLNLAVNALLIPRYGVFGAAAATFVTWAAYMVVCWVIANAEHRLPVKISAYALIAALACAIYAVAQVARVEALLPQLLLDAAWALTFCVLALLLFFTAEERRSVMGLAGSLLAWAWTRWPAPPLAAGGAAAVVLLGPAGRPAETLRARAHVVAQVRTGPAAVGDDALALTGGAARLARLLAWALPHQDGMRHVPWEYRAAVTALREGAVLVSSQGPAPRHLAALGLKHRFGVPWIAELEPPSAAAPARPTRRARLLDPLLERAVIDGADAVLLHDAGFAAALAARYPEAAAKLHLAPAALNGDGGADLLIELIGKVRVTAD
ncbi:MAG: oligosaccharide flippase family protein [Janthinobacterium lividum]